MRRASVSLCVLRLARIAVPGAAMLLGAGVPARAAGDIELGRYLATECMTCHGASSARAQIPDIFGVAEETFEQVVKAYRSKQLPNEVMQTVAARLKDDEIAALATYFARTKKPSNRR